MEKANKEQLHLDESKRETIRILVRTAAFTAPIVTTFAVDGKMSTALSGLSASSNS